MDLTTPISQLTKVGKTSAKRLEKLGVKTVQDLLYYFPFRYDDYRQVLPINKLMPGDKVTIRAQIELIANKRSFRKRRMITEVLVADNTGGLRVVWFNQPYLAKTLKPGDWVYLSGVVKGQIAGLELMSPVYEKDLGKETAHTARLVPIYPLTAGLTEKQIRFLVSVAMPLCQAVPEWLPSEILEKYDLAPLPAALAGIHFPHNEKELALATNRLKFDELFFVQLQANLSCRQRLKQTAPELKFFETEIKQFVQSLPFTLTKTQKIAAWEILQDIAKIMPMNRLLSGDVGSGKTVVGAMAMYNTVLNGYQAVLMAPTEILAQQHFKTVSKLLEKYKVKVALLTSNQASCHSDRVPRRHIGGRVEESLSSIGEIPRLPPRLAPLARGPLGMTATKKSVINEINRGGIDVIIGTHALLSEGVEFKKLGLAIVDEQHRFGVEQRKLIKQKATIKGTLPDATVGMLDFASAATPQAKSAHFLSMTATPIPRSLALMMYGDLDISIINELPPGRKKIITRLVEPFKRDKAYGFIHDQVKLGRQVFVVCPLIEEKEQGERNKEKGEGGVILKPLMAFSFFATPLSEKKSVLSEYEKLSKKIFPNLRVGYLHGKLKPKEKEETMNKFKNGEIDVLVSTSVVEVGVDVPNASVMMIEGAERFGLAQLHQFRGRVGRSTYQSYCLLFTDSDSGRALERLKYFELHHDGFKLAEKDLAMRGPGEVYGIEQSGMNELKLATLMDKEIIKKAQDAAKQVVDDLEKYPELAKKFAQWERAVHLE